LYLSVYLRRHKAEYYDRLMAVREDGNWEGWLSFFLRGIRDAAREASDKAQDILRLREEHRSLIDEHNQGINGLKLLALLFRRPIINVNLVKDSLGTSFATANSQIEQFEKLGFLHEITGQRRNRIFRYSPYLDLFAEVIPSPAQDVPSQTTEANEPRHPFAGAGFHGG
jgi:Fic family protein